MLDTLRPLLDAARDLDLSDPAAAETVLNERLDPAGEEGLRLSAALAEAVREGRVADRGEPPVRFSRVAKPGDATDGFSIDAVDMTGPGPRHTHPAGEVDFCVALEGEPTFDGRPPGWVVYPPGSTHVPTVAGGRMAILYLLPGGAIEFEGR